MFFESSVLVVTNYKNGNILVVINDKTASSNLVLKSTAGGFLVAAIIFFVLAEPQSIHGRQKEKTPTEERPHFVCRPPFPTIIRYLPLRPHVSTEPYDRQWTASGERGVVCA